MSEATVKLFFDADKTKLVLEDDPEAKILAAAVGDEIPEGYKVPSVKQADKAANKMADAPADKSGSGVKVTKGKS
jgi:hypothetical protein